MSEWLVEALVPILLLDLPMSLTHSLKDVHCHRLWLVDPPPESKPRSLGEGPFILKTAEIVKSLVQSQGYQQTTGVWSEYNVGVWRLACLWINICYLCGETALSLVEPLLVFDWTTQWLVSNCSVWSWLVAAKAVIGGDVKISWISSQWLVIITCKQLWSRLMFYWLV